MPLPKEKLTFYRLNARVAKTFQDCDYCNKVQTKGRDAFGEGMCEKCFAKLRADLNQPKTIS